ncbi:hypothetical protein [Paraburkholderia ribeironis]|uniref:hypothetical protein n=1 Tax=Paraburkholderia ribeironis TaxID=1247936 RepID=UPI00135663D0|nr:hypothetical protein [Paraburkholderia ribeironis]
MSHGGAASRTVWAKPLDRAHDEQRGPHADYAERAHDDLSNGAARISNQSADET